MALNAWHVVITICRVLIAASFLMGAAMTAYEWLVHRDAKKHVEAHCRTVSVGVPSAGIADTARMQGFHVVVHPGVKAGDGRLIQDATILVSESLFFETFRCQIRHNDTTVTGVHMSGHFH